MAHAPKKVLLIADYGKNDLAFFEVRQRLYDLAVQAGEKIAVDIVSADPFNTAQTAALVKQAAEEGNYDVIYHNTAPRKDTHKERIDNDGEFLAYASYWSDARQRWVNIVGVYAGDENSVNTFALLDENKCLNNIRRVQCPTKGSQFRSRDVFPPHVIAALQPQRIKLEHEPVNVSKSANPSLVEKAAAQAGDRLAEAKEQLARHGDAGEGYVTVVTPPDAARAALEQLARDPYYQKAEIDALPLKSDGENAWIESAFVAAQLALGSGQPRRRSIVLLHDAHWGSADRPLYQATLDNGATVITDALKNLYFVRGHIEKINERHSLEPVRRDELNEWSLPAEITPVYTDGYGNVKLSIKFDDLQKKHLRLIDDAGKSILQPGERQMTQVCVNNHDLEACVADGSFHVKDGDVALSRGSSGWALRGESNKNHFTEVFLRGGSAAEKLGNPKPGDYVRVVAKHRVTEEPGHVLEADNVTRNISEKQVGVGG